EPAIASVARAREQRGDVGPSAPLVARAEGGGAKDGRRLEEAREEAPAPEEIAQARNGGVLFLDGIFELHEAQHVAAEYGKIDVDDELGRRFDGGRAGKMRRRPHAGGRGERPFVGNSQKARIVDEKRGAALLAVGSAGGVNRIVVPESELGDV